MSKIDRTEPSAEESGRGPRLDRRLLLAAGAASVGIAAGLVAGAEPAEAANGNPVELGEINSETVTTTITNTASGAFSGNTSANGGHSGVHGNDTSTGGGYGVAGNSDNGYGVYGTTSGIGKAGVFGTSPGLGVTGQPSIGIGVQGTSEYGTGVYAGSVEGYALQAVGTSQFQGSVQFSESGLATVAATESSVTVSEAALTKSSLVLATLQGAPLAGVWVQTVVPDVATKSFKIILSAKVPTGKTAKVGWFVMN